MKEPTLQTSLFRRYGFTVVIRTPIVMYRKAEFHIHSLDVMRGPHRLWVVLLPPKNMGPMSWPLNKIAKKFIRWQWDQEPGCEYVNPNEVST